MQTKTSTETITPRGTRVMLPHGGLPEIFPPYLSELIQKTGGADGPIGRQFVARPQLERRYSETGMKDPLIEDHHEVSPGLVYKYTGKKEKNGHITWGRALFTVTRHCAAYCRFCTRGREVGMVAGWSSEARAALAHAPHLSQEQIEQTLEFIKKEPYLNEVILSGGDPLTIRPDMLHFILAKLGELQRNGKLSVVRIGTRVPVHNPRMMRDDHYTAIRNLKNPRLMVHINHPLELTAEMLAVLARFRQDCGAVVMSQTVLLKGVNDDTETLYELFTKLTEEGVVPYYLIQNDAVYWAKHFTVPIKKGIRIWETLRPRLSGVAATARYVIDVANGYGKMPIPEGKAWSVDYDAGFWDFHGKHFSLTYDTPKTTPP